MAVAGNPLVRQASPAFPAEGILRDVEKAARFVRQHVIAAIYRAGFGHPAGALSSADILACLFGAEINFWPDAIDDPHRDRFILSNRHAAPALYGVAARYGFCDASPALSPGKFKSPFPGHPDVGGLPWAEAGAGSPGQGFSVALGMAMGLKLLKRTSRVYALLGDDELHEGEVWEAAMCAVHHRLDNLCVLVDYNRPQSDEPVIDTVAIEPLAAKWRAFEWAAAEIDGHDIPTILSTLRRASATHGRPSVIIARTIGGKGVPFMEGQPQWRGGTKLMANQAREALRALGATREEIKEWLDGSEP